MANKPFLTMRTRLPSHPEAMAKLGVDERGKVQQHVTEEVFRRIGPYIPFKSGNLRGTAFVKTPTSIRVWARYARVQFFGVTKSGKPFNYNRNGNPKAGSHWDRRLMADEGAAIVADANRFVRGGKGEGGR